MNEVKYTKCTNCGVKVIQPDDRKTEPLCDRCSEQIHLYYEALEYEQKAREVLYRSVKRPD